MFPPDSMHVNSSPPIDRLIPAFAPTRVLCSAFILMAVPVLSLADFPQIELVPISEDELTAPVAIRSANDGSDRLFLVDQRGLIQIIENGTLLPTPFLDIESKLSEHNGGFDERGLLSMAFHPDYSNDGQPGFGKFYVYYSAPSPNSPGTTNDPVNHQSVVAEYAVDSSDPNVAEGMSERILLKFDQPQFNHNGGDLAFGPQDGLLYISTGDGGGSDDNNPGHTGGSSTKPSDALGNAQDKTKLLGKILRIDPLGNDGPGGEYGIPGSNPFAGEEGGVREEIFAHGLRNPWRICFDSGPGGTNRFFVADVGQGEIEEVNLVNIGDNLGWRNREGSFVFAPDAPGTGPFVEPIVEYAHPGIVAGNLPQIGKSVTGGCFYRGGRFASLEGKYIFGDWSDSFGTPNGTLLGMEETSPGVFSLSVLDVVGGNPIGEYITAFGTGENGEVYVATREVAAPENESGTGRPTGKIFRIQPSLVKTMIEFEPFKDNSLYAESPNSNGVGNWLFSGITNQPTEGNPRRALLAFDVQSLVPSDAIITDVSLQLNSDKKRDGSGPTVFDLHRLEADWGEGNSNAAGDEGVGIAATTGDATWDYAFFDTVAWTSPGGDFSAIPSATTTIGEIGVYSWSAPRLVDDVQSWIDGALSNYGWILLTADTTMGNARRFKSRESALTEDRPKLTVTYVIDDFVDAGSNPGVSPPSQPPLPVAELAKLSKQIKKAKKALRKQKKKGNTKKAAKIRKKLKKLARAKRALLR